MQTNVEIPWNWYVVRASALVGFILLYIAIFFGTVSRLPGIRKIFLRLGSLKFHCWISVQAFLFAAIHGANLLFDKAIPFSIADVLVPFHSKYSPGLVALGVISFYVMAVLVLTSYSRRFFSYKTWRAIHFLNIALYGMAIVHALFLGTDLKTGILREIFIWANGFLILLLVINLLYRVRLAFRSENIISGIGPEKNYENIRESDSALRPERSIQNFRRRI